MKADPARRMSRPLAALGGHNQSRHLHPFLINHAVRWSCKSVVVRMWRYGWRWECTSGAHSHRGEEPIDAGRLEWRPFPWRMLMGSNWLSRGGAHADNPLTPSLLRRPLINISGEQTEPSLVGLGHPDKFEPDLPVLRPSNSRQFDLQGRRTGREG